MSENVGQVVIGGVRELLPVLPERAQETEDSRNVPAESVKALTETGFFRLLQPGRFGGHRKSRIYGRLDCPAALRAIVGGGYAAHRVFFADEQTAVAAGYRPCAVCLPGAYAAWKAR